MQWTILGTDPNSKYEIHLYFIYVLPTLSESNFKDISVPKF